MLIKFNIKTLSNNFNKFTHYVERFFTNEKKEITKIIKDFWVEHYITDLLKISFILTLIVGLCCLIYYDVGYSHVTLDEINSIKGEVDKALHINKIQNEIIDVQAKKIQEMTNTINHYKTQPYAVGVFVTTAVTLGFVLGYATTVIVLLYTYG